MKILENKAICIVLALALVIAGFIIGGCRSLNSLYSSKVEKVFMTGEDGDGICIENDLAERETAAVNLCTIASKYDSTKKQADEVREAAAELSSASSVAFISYYVRTRCFNLISRNRPDEQRVVL